MTRKLLDQTMLTIKIRRNKKEGDGNEHHESWLGD